MQPLDLIPLIDLTSLGEADTEADITRLCHNATTDFGPVAAVCVYPKFITLAKQLLTSTSIKIATVANFPSGSDDINTTLNEVSAAIDSGADEIDIVLPYHALLKGDTNTVGTFLQQCRSHTKNHTLKIILETGCLSETQIKEASRLAIAADVDFIKTSTGKVEVGATTAAAKIMLEQIKASGKIVGLKVSGGIRTPQQALEYAELAQTILGQGWVCPEHFRIGASSLLQAVLDDANPVSSIAE